VPIARVTPEPVDKAWLARHGGTAVLMIFVDAEGTVVAPEVVKPLGLGLDQEALRAVRKWKFQPASKNGTPVAASVLVEVTFAQFAGQR
jgi:TonB family protein